MWLIQQSSQINSKDLGVPYWGLSAIGNVFLSHRYDKAIIIIIIIEQLKNFRKMKDHGKLKGLEIYKFLKLETLLLFWEKHSFISVRNYYIDFNRLNQKKIAFL